MHADCDGDSLVYLAQPVGPSCHTGARTCWFRAARPATPATLGADASKSSTPSGAGQEHASAAVQWVGESGSAQGMPLSTLLALEATIAERQRAAETDTSGALSHMLRAALVCVQGVWRWWDRGLCGSHKPLQSIWPMRSCARIPVFRLCTREACTWPAALLRRSSAPTAATRVAGGKPSWTARLLADEALLCAKVREEAGELTQALEEDEGTERVASEAADLLYHALVLLRAAEVPAEEVLAVLRARFGTSGVAEKAARPAQAAQ